MFAHGKPKRLVLPMLTDETLRDLLGEILTPESEAALESHGRADVVYDGGALGAFKVTLTARTGGIDAVFLRGGSAAKPRERPQLVVVPTEPAAPEPPQAQPQSRHEPSSLLRAWVELAASMNASDVHLADGAPPVVRIEGVLKRIDSALAVDVAGLLGDAHTTLTRNGSVDTALDVIGVRRVRLHAYVTDEGLAAAIRLLPERAPSFASLQMPIGFDDLIGLPHGLVLVCGASGAGKSTTLAALAQEALQRHSIVLITLEDPIEYALDGGASSIVRRRQVGRDVRDFASGLRDALREDPDVLLVGEMRDAETIALALTAAETGHLVLASIHSRGAASAIERIVDAYPAGRQQQIRSQLADSLRAVIAQRLVRRARGSGRVPAIEVLRTNHAIASLIREGKTAQIASAIQSGRREGMLALERCLADRVQASDIRLEDARAAADDLTLLASYLGR
jgi:twitching motility protein PilT